MNERIRKAAVAILEDQRSRTSLFVSMCGARPGFPANAIDAILDAALRELTEPRLPTVGRF